jgi:cell division septal protein FtsQ
MPMRRKCQTRARRRFLVYRTEVKQYRNPFSRHNQKKARRFKIVGILVILIVLALSYFLFYSKTFKIENIEISGTRNIRHEDIRSLVEAQLKKSWFLVFNQDNFFILSKNNLAKNITDKYVLDDLIITKTFSRTLKVEIKEKVSQIIWASGSKYYNLDSNGIAISEIGDLNDNKPVKSDKKSQATEVMVVAEEPKFFEIKIDGQDFNSFPIIVDESNKDVSLGQAIIKPEIVSIALNLIKKIPSKVNISISSFKMPDPASQELKAVTTEGWEIYFDANKDLEAQLNNLKMVLDQKIKDRNALQYIDLRFGNRVYYK